MDWKFFQSSRLMKLLLIFPITSTISFELTLKFVWAFSLPLATIIFQISYKEKIRVTIWHKTSHLFFFCLIQIRSIFSYSREKWEIVIMWLNLRRFQVCNVKISHWTISRTNIIRRLLFIYSLTSKKVYISCTKFNCIFSIERRRKMKQKINRCLLFACRWIS